MGGEHPSELTLLAYAEDELEGGERSTIESHLAGCETCAADVALVRRGRDAARAAPLLELPPGAQERILAGLPEQEPASRVPARRWLAVAAPIAAALAVVAGVATLATTGDRAGDGDGGDAAEGLAPESAGEDSDAEGGAATTGAAALFKSVAGNPDRVARELRRQGFDARVENRTVVVRTDRTAALDRALADFPRGAVRVRVE